MNVKGIILKYFPAPIRFGFLSAHAGRGNKPYKFSALLKPLRDIKKQVA